MYIHIQVQIVKMQKHHEKSIKIVSCKSIGYVFVRPMSDRVWYTIEIGIKSLLCLDVTEQ